MKYLVIVESPAKCTKIEKYLNEGDDVNIYKVVASMGHFMELRTIKNIDIENGFTFKYEYIEAKKKNTDMIKKLRKQYDDVILACDNDREGAGICYSICQLLSLDVTKTKRIVFNEITESAILRAVQAPSLLDMNLVRAQQTRQILDMLIGFKVSPILWKLISRNKDNALSAGRCQTPALRLIYDNQQDINKNEERKVYNTIGYFTNSNLPFELNKQFESEDITDFLYGSTDFTHIYSCSQPTKVFKKQPEPFTTSRLQQVASNELHYSPKETMKLCQTLYEKGYITYMRTDSKTYSQEFIQEIKKYIIKTYPSEQYIGQHIDELICGVKKKEKTASSKKVKERNACAPNPNTPAPQEAHEAIRPTNISLFELPSELHPREKRMYKLIRETTLESCMSPASYFSISASVTGFNNTKFVYVSEQIDFPGWKIVANQISNEKEKNKEFVYLQQLKQNNPISYNKMVSKVSIKGGKQHYTEARLVQLLEEKGIGRPSTFSSLVDKIQERGYVKKEDIKGKEVVCKEFELQAGEIFELETKREFGNEKDKLVIQPLGIIVMEFLEKHFNDLFCYEYTSAMEEILDKIAKGTYNWIDICDSCNQQVDEMVNGLQKETKMEYKIDDRHTYIIGKYGPVLKCVTNDSENQSTIVFKPLIKDIDMSKLEKGEYNAEDLIDTKSLTQKNQKNLGKYEDKDVIVKKGKFGLYAVWGTTNKSLKELGNRPIENITLFEITKFLTMESGIVREVSKNITIRKGAKGDYIFYKTSRMKKPQFFSILGCKDELEEPIYYKTCKIDVLKLWIHDKYNIE